MGATYCCGLSFFCAFETSDWIDLFGVLINAFLAIWIVRTIQNRLTNKRVLKDYFIDEIKDIRNEYRNSLSNLYDSKTHPKTVTPWFKLMNIKVTDLMTLIHSKYKIDKNKLLPYQVDLQELITNNEDFISQFRGDGFIEFSESSRVQIIKFQQDYSNLFNELIIAINDAN